MCAQFNPGPWTRYIPNALLGIIPPLIWTSCVLVSLDVLRRAFLCRYVDPKELRFSWEQAQKDAPGVVQDVQRDEPPVIQGDQEVAFGNIVAFLSVACCNNSSLSVVAHVLNYPREWGRCYVNLLTMLCVHVSLRVGWAQRSGEALLARAGAPECLRRKAHVNALTYAHYHNMTGCRYLSILVLITCSALRALVREDARCFLFLDRGPSVALVLLGTCATVVLEDALVARLHWRGQCAYPEAARLPRGHPLRTLALGQVGGGGYTFAYGLGSMWLAMMMAMTVGPSFMSGVCPGPSTQEVLSWVETVPCK